VLQQPAGDLSGLMNPESIEDLQKLARTRAAAGGK